ncbi:MAG TPA: chloride channel protein [Acidimicrobiales bacterium]|nr:chloride channel protein [Acidimicrobiales bacterium]
MSRPSRVTGQRTERILVAIIGGVVGGSAGAVFVVVVTDWIKHLLALVTKGDDWVLVVVPLIGITLAVVILQVFGKGTAAQHLDDAPAAPKVGFHPWRSFPLDLARADLTADVVASAGREERFPWRLAPIRTIAIVTSVGLGAPLGTESPAAHLGTAAGSALGSRRWAQRMARSAGLGGGAAAVAALIGLPLVGLVFILELGRRRRIAVSVERVLAAGAGATVGWLLNTAFGLDFISLAVPHIAPGSLGQVLVIALVVGGAAGAVSGVTGVVIYAARAWEPHPAVKLAVGAAALGLVAVALLVVSTPSAAVGPGGGAVLWADTAGASGWAMLGVALLRAAATTAAVTAGGCGGVFVPFLAIGDLTGRAFVPLIGGPPDLAGAAGAAGGISGGYRLPVTAIAMVIGVGGPFTATATCLGTVAVATASGLAVPLGLDRLLGWRSVASRPADNESD